MMKKVCLKRVLAMLIAGMLLLSLSACAVKLNGTYTSTDGLVKQSFTFDKDGNVQVSAFGIDVNGTYTIEDDIITITYSLLNLSYDLEKPFRKDGSSIFIDGIEFVKES